MVHFIFISDKFSTRSTYEYVCGLRSSFLSTRVDVQHAHSSVHVDFSSSTARETKTLNKKTTTQRYMYELIPATAETYGDEFNIAPSGMRQVLARTLIGN